jgi:uncharacterized protein YdeI (YjbR/CyaY-like superfamily)
VVRMTGTLYVTNRDDWRAWLEKNHDAKREVWLIYYKRHTGKPRIPYDAAVEEALCFGWIDSIVKRIDDEKYVQKFTPRGAKSKWSELNIKRTKKMIREGRMTKAGLAKCKEVLKGGGKESKAKPKDKKLIVPSDLIKALAKKKKSWENFNSFAPSYKRQYIRWMTDAKKEETRKKRINRIVEWAEQNKKPGML